jgi:tetratricopeptide (TPR) repeat protein
LVGEVTDRGTVPRRLTPIFKDRDELPSATDLGGLINAALADSAAQIIICSPRAAKSKYVNEEILAFKRLGREDRILCIIVDGEPNASDIPGREEEECFPPALRFRLGADGNLSASRTEPIAADARTGKDGKSNAKLKLISGLLGVGYDALRRREQQRRNARLFAFSCAAAAGMVLTSGLAAYALLQRAAAQRETLRAEAEARTSKEATRFLVDLFKIFDPSEARGNTVTAREMMDKGAVRIETELAGQPAIQATLMDTVGTVYMGLGLYTQARPLIDGAVSKRRRLQGIDPLDLSDSLSHQGELMALQADYDTGEGAYREAIRIESALPKDRQSQEKLANSLYGLGTLLAKQGRSADAEQSLREALERQKALYGETHPAVARTLKDLANAVADRGDLNSAIPLMERAVAMQRALRGSEPHPDLAEVLNDMGALLWRQGDVAACEKFFRESLAMNRRLLGDKHPEIANGLENVAMSIQDKGDLAGAEKLYRQSLEMRRELLGAEHPEVGRTLANLASLQYDRGETHEALANMREVLTIYRKVYPKDHPETARILNTMGSWLTMEGEHGEAETYLGEGLAMRRRLFNDQHPDVASSLIALAILRVDEKNYDAALESARGAKAIYSAALSPDHWRTALAECAEGAALTGLGRFSEAEKPLTHGHTIVSKESGLPLIYKNLAQRYFDALRRSEKTQVADATKQNAARP